MVEHLNEGINNIAASCTTSDGLKQTRGTSRRGTSVQLTKDLTKNIGSVIGSKLLKTLNEVDQIKEPYALRAAISAAFTFFFNKTWLTWPFSPLRGARTLDVAIDLIWPTYKRIFASGTLLVARLIHAL